MVETIREDTITIPEIRDLRIELARQSFWDFCQTLYPDFYKDERQYLIDLCAILEDLYNESLLKADGSPYKRFIINMPPRHGKTRTLVLFTSWALGKNKQERIIACSYNDNEAQDFSKYTRNIIQEPTQDFEQITYSDIFPETRIKRGDAASGEWALEGEYFSYKGSGLGGAITGKGGTILIVDDPIKDAETAYNENALDKIWTWYIGTFMSRREEGAIEIVNHTRWAKKDPCGRILESEDSGEWYVYQLEVYDKTTDKMLCDELLSRKSYEYNKRNMDEAIFEANYHHNPIDIKGVLYKDLKLYTEIPTDDKGNPRFERIINYTDTADEGDCFLCSICAGEINGELYIIDVYYTKAGMEVTEPETAKFLHDNFVSLSKIESNNGGRGFARNVTKGLWDTFKSRLTVTWFHQSKNKMARILTNANFIMKNVYFPYNWKIRWPEFYRAMTAFQKDGKNKYLDGPDALTGLAEMIDEKYGYVVKTAGW